ncbi:MAG: CZB domain-containing protein [Bdellovibrio sp.]|nr:CZB domain-containing protein [Bdellovibrio sp.]
MNFDDAIQAHVNWKMKLQIYLRRPDKSLNPATIEPDCNCDLGKWIHGEGGARYMSDPKFVKLLNDHAKFHKVAAEVVRKADSGQSVSEETALGSKSEFAILSQAIVITLVEMRMGWK